MAFQPSVRLELGGNSFPQWVNITLQRKLNTLAGISLTIDNPAGLRTTLPTEDMAIKLWLGWDTDNPPVRFDGYMDDPSWSITKKAARITMSGRDFGRPIFDEMTVDSAFATYGQTPANGYIFDYLSQMADNLANPILKAFSRNLIDDVSNTFQYVFAYNKVIKELNKLRIYGNYEWFMGHDTGGNRKWFVRPPKDLVAANVSHAFVVGDVVNYTDIPSQAEIQHISGLSVKQQYGFKKNYVKVQGTGVSAVWPAVPPSAPKHLYYEDDGIIASGDASQVAQRLYMERAAPKTLVDFSGIGVETLNVGDVVYVNDWRYGLSELPTHIFRIVGIRDTISMNGWDGAYKVADFTPTIFDFFKDTTGL